MPFRNEKNMTRLNYQSSDGIIWSPGVCYNLLLMAADCLVVYGLLCAGVLIFNFHSMIRVTMICFRLSFVPLVAIGIHAFGRMYGGSLFYPGFGVNRIEELKRCTISVFCTYLVIFAALGFTQLPEEFNRLSLLFGMFLTMLILPAVRGLLPRLCSRFGFLQRKLLIAGATRQGKRIAEELKKTKSLNVCVVGYLDDNVVGPEVLGHLKDHAKVAKEYDLSFIAVALPPKEQQKWIREFLKSFRHILLFPFPADSPILCTYPTLLGKLPALEMSNHLKMPIYRVEKYLSELLITVLLLPCFLPVCLLIAIAVKLTSRGPVFYRARRLGMNGKPIRVLKFRTMYQDADKILEQMLEENPKMKREWEKKFKLNQDPRVTPLGRFLRKTSLDELPQFWNVLCREMAIIGPRPIVEEETKYYGDRMSIFSMVKPGITGLWQVSGRSSISYEERVNLDVFYVSDWSIWLDYYIFLKTIVVVLFRKGAV